jgi:hypothetical protein
MFLLVRLWIGSDRCYDEDKARDGVDQRLSPRVNPCAANNKRATCAASGFEGLVNEWLEIEEHTGSRTLDYETTSTVQFAI